MLVKERLMKVPPMMEVAQWAMTVVVIVMKQIMAKTKLVRRVDTDLVIKRITEKILRRRVVHLIQVLMMPVSYQS
ncbi:MAG: hypothetical protein EBV86_17480 [Marivivens sp.]|nr:hypothetical protein [Marivivens sp.]NCW70317.1 hypothetical protein [Marivivens sp.]